MDLNDLQNNLGIKFNDISYLEHALIHRSFLNEAEGDDISSNERLEFLGDAVLQFLSSEYLYREFTEFSEGELTNIRSKIVNTEALAKETRRLKLIDCLKISNGEQETAYESKSIQANTFEAVLGAIFLDQGISVCRTYLEKQLFYIAEDIIATGELKDPKSLFQELSQEKFGVTPDYKVLSDEGPDHNKTFKIGAYIKDELIAEGTGSSKRKAQQEAASIALVKYEKADENLK